MNEADFGSEEAASLGGKARAKSMSEEDRRESARKAAEARWAKHGKEPMPRATHGRIDRPLRLGGGIEIPCFVLGDGRRVVTLNGMLKAIGMKRGSGQGGEGGNRLERFSTGKSVRPFFSSELLGVMKIPIKFQLPPSIGGGGGGGGGENWAYGYEAQVLVDLCDVVLRARDAKALRTHQAHVAVQCEILVRSLAKTGIIALVDEATGYQDDRARDALAKILEAFVARELRKWVKTFPVDYYRELYRLKGLAFPPTGNKMPRYFGTLTNDIVYSRLAPGVLKELKSRNPPNEQGYRKHRHTQWLTEEFGHPKLLQHLAATIAVMRLAGDGDYEGFHKLLDRALPKYGTAPLFEQANGEAE
jgi:hypothetical protein